MQADMKHRILLFASILVLTMFLEGAASAQPTCAPPLTRAWLRVSDNGGANDTLWFGFDSTATCGVDSHLCEYSSLLCDHSGLFCALWRPQCTSGALPVLGEYDYRPFRFTGQVDTFKIAFQPSDAGFPMQFQWNRNDILAMCDSVVLVDGFGGLFYRVRMDLSDSLVVANPAFSSLYLFAYGARQSTTGFSSERELVTSFQLSQNYPNPFNPTTNLEFRIAKSEFVSLRIFDVLGREVSILVNETLPAGTYKRTFDATGLASGVYLYRLSTNSGTEVRKMILTK